MTAPVGRIVRYTFGERLLHGVSALSYLYLLLTGLAFWTPGLYWMAVMLGGGYLSRLLHPWIGLIFTGALVAMYVIWRRDMQAAPEDRAWRDAMRHYVRNQDAQVPAIGRFNYGQKSFFRAMVIGGAALLLSGLVLWFVDAIPWELRVLRHAAVLVHAVAALVTIAGFIVHIYMGVFVVPEGAHAIVHGDVTEDWARAHHRLWFEQLQAARFAGGQAPDDGSTRSADVQRR